MNLVYIPEIVQWSAHQKNSGFTKFDDDVHLANDFAKALPPPKICQEYSFQKIEVHYCIELITYVNSDVCRKRKKGFRQVNLQPFLSKIGT